MRHAVLGGLLASACLASACASTGCGPDVLGTSRTLTLQREAAAYGMPQHAALPLARGEVVLTFDDGPRPGSTTRVLDALRQQCVRATFLMVGESLQRYPALARQVRAEGHSVGMHGFAHAHAAAQSEANQRADLRAVQAAWGQVFDGAAPVYRFPFLEETPTLVDALKTQGITILSMDVGVDDWLPAQGPRVLAARLAERLALVGRGIILLHDVQDQTADALPLLLATLKAQGYRVVHLDWEQTEPFPAVGVSRDGRFDKAPGN
jgi:peptidoglycan/xylan/chitin deacetylase (PgdA/CDA1 family)